VIVRSDEAKNEYLDWFKPGETATETFLLKKRACRDNILSFMDFLMVCKISGWPSSCGKLLTQWISDSRSSTWHYQKLAELISIECRMTPSVMDEGRAFDRQIVRRIMPKDLEERKIFPRIVAHCWPMNMINMV
jgi:hypothetical protein